MQSTSKAICLVETSPLLKPLDIITNDTWLDNGLAQMHSINSTSQSTCRDFDLSQELALSFLSDKVFIKFFIVAPKPLLGVCPSANWRPSGWASKHF